MKERWYPRTATDADMGRTKRKGWVPLAIDLRYLAQLQDAHADETQVGDAYCASCGSCVGFEPQAGDASVLICLACGDEGTRVEG